MSPILPLFHDEPTHRFALLRTALQWVRDISQVMFDTNTDQTLPIYNSPWVYSEEMVRYESPETSPWESYDEHPLIHVV